MSFPCSASIQLNRYLDDIDQECAKDQAIEARIADLTSKGGELDPLEQVNYLSALNDLSQAELCETETGELAATAALLREGKHDEYCKVISRLLKTYWIKEAAKMADDFYH